MGTLTRSAWPMGVHTDIAEVQHVLGQGPGKASVVPQARDRIDLEAEKVIVMRRLGHPGSRSGSARVQHLADNEEQPEPHGQTPCCQTHPGWPVPIVAPKGVTTEGDTDKRERDGRQREQRVRHRSFAAITGRAHPACDQRDDECNQPKDTERGG